MKSKQALYSMKAHSKGRELKPAIPDAIITLRGRRERN